MNTKTTAAAAALLLAVGLSACGGGSGSEGGSDGSSAQSSSGGAAYNESPGEEMTVGKSVRIGNSDTHVTLVKAPAKFSGCTGTAAPDKGKHAVAYELKLETEKPSGAIALQGTWTAEGKKTEEVDGLLGDMCQDPSKQFPLDWKGKKQVTATKVFIVPDGATKLVLTTVENKKYTFPAV
ncbi:hypothetical protein [Arthrobacter sp. UM1]|uniref:hypothetical protein n=1 Tax=Arthrobacter sp. UM1 TaxID=2766776 RepID=UPI001CF693D6|nr:hypothetical protein [Arthrobacter sp. UM1]MCB4208658.1 hypothetical protein [Arthrobacter sp. UM1]